MQMIRRTAWLAWLLAAGCASAGPRTLVYECPDGFEATVRLEADRAWLFLPDRTIDLPRLSSGSGIHYAKGSLGFWGKGDEALFEIDGVTHFDCRNNPRRAVWEHAKLNGADFRAVGNEPGWHLEIHEGTRILLVTDYGEHHYRFDNARRTDRPLEHSSIYRARRDGHALELVLRAEPCRNSMSGETFETRVTVRLDDRTLRGCGRALH